MFCEKFNTQEEAIENVGSKACKDCKNLSYQDGMLTCSLMESMLELNKEELK